MGVIHDVVKLESIIPLCTPGVVPFLRLLSFWLGCCLYGLFFEWIFVIWVAPISFCSMLSRSVSLSFTSSSSLYYYSSGVIPSCTLSFSAGTSFPVGVGSWITSCVLWEISSASTQSTSASLPSSEALYLSWACWSSSSTSASSTSFAYSLSCCSASIPSSSTCTPDLYFTSGHPPTIRGYLPLPLGLPRDLWLRQ